MKLFFTSIAVVLSMPLSMAQNIGIGTNTPHPSAILDVSSTTKGMLAPRMNSTQRNNIPAPAKGLLVYDTDLNSLFQFNGTQWSVLGPGNGTLTLPFSATPAYAGAAFQIDNKGTAIEGITSGATNAVRGTATGVGTYGVLGSNALQGGVGLAGNTINGSGAYGFSAGAGTALRGISTNGYALLSSGNLRLTGGNTTPSAGAVLTSIDDNGNAVWKQDDIAFALSGASPWFNTINDYNVWHKVHFAYEDYDLSNSALTTSNGSPLSSNSSFTAPIPGLYRIAAQVELTYNQLRRYKDDIRAVIYKPSANTTSVVSEWIYEDEYWNAETFNMPLQIDVKLEAGDQLFIEVRSMYSLEPNIGCTIGVDRSKTFLSGYLLIAD